MIYAAIAIAWLLSIGGAFWYGQDVGADSVIASNAKTDQAIRDTRAEIRAAVAEGVSKIKVENTTVNTKAQTIIREKQVMIDCRSGPELVDLFNRQQPPKAAKP